MGLRGWLKEYVGIGGEGKVMPSTPPKDSGLRQIEEEKRRKKKGEVDIGIAAIKGGAFGAPKIPKD